MRLTTLPLMIVAASLSHLGIAHADVDIERAVNEQVARVRSEFSIPGVAITLVRTGELPLTRGFGVRTQGQSATVDQDTVFAIGSNTKAFTTAALGILVDDGKLGWDDRVIDHLPDFQMYDPWVTREITVRDLLVHRSGLGTGAGDLLFWPRSTYTRADVVRRIRYIKPATSFRSGYAYDNLLYIVAGQLIEAVSGRSWEQFIRERVFTPANMDRSTISLGERLQLDNRAAPHAAISGAIRGMGTLQVLDERDEEGPSAAPAGSISSSAADLANWLAIQLSQGSLPNGQRLYTEAVGQEMWNAQVPMPIAPLAAPLTRLTPNFSAYALGWEVRDYAGAKVVMHGGSAAGFNSMIVLVPSRQTGFAVLMNAEHGAAIQSIVYELLDQVLDQPRHDWISAFREARERSFAQAQHELALAAQVRHARSSPSLPLASYAGVYRDPWYGLIEIRTHDRGLQIEFKHTPGMIGELEHWQFNTFRTRWRDRGIEDAFVTFSLDAGGNIARADMRAVSPLADFSFDYQDLELTPIGQDKP